MKRATISGIAVLLSTVLVGCQCAKSPDTVTENTVQLFDGKTLDGWTSRGGQAVFTVEDGAIVGETRPNTPNTFLCTNAEYSDFKLSFEFLVDPKLNSGVQFRSHVRTEKGGERVYGYQAEIDPSARAFTAGLYEEAGRGWLQDLKDNPAGQAAFKQNEWNSMVIECRGSSIRTWLNGVAVTDFVDTESASGFIGLQVHGVGTNAEPMQVRWRNIKLLPLE